MSSILAKKIYQNQTLIFSRPGMSIIDSATLENDPRTAWLVLNEYCCGGNEQYQLTFEQPKQTINVIKGVWIQAASQGYLIDGNVDDVQQKLDSCCGSNAVVTQNYQNGLPAYQAPLLKTYTIVRTDDGTVSAMIDAELAYAGNGHGKGDAQPNTFIKVSRDNNAGTTTYQFQAYEDPAPKGSDQITETARVITSNSYTNSLTGSNVYNLTGEVDDINISVKGSTSLSSLAAALTADPTAGPLGTWAVAGSTITLTTTTNDAGVLTIGQVAP